MHGGVSHVDTFDPKPKLAEMNGRPLPIAKPKFEFGGTGNLLRSPWKFAKYGESGTEVSELFPHLAGCVDDLCIIRSMNGGNQVSHGPALLTLNTGDGVFNRPSLGAWTLYGLGTENSDLPGFISLSPSLYHGGAQNYGSAFLPASFQGTRIGDGGTPFSKAVLSNTRAADDPRRQRLQLELLESRNREHHSPNGARPTTGGPNRGLRNGLSNANGGPAGDGPDCRNQGNAQLVRHRSRAHRRVRQAVSPGPPVQRARGAVRAGQLQLSANYWDAHGDLKNNHATNAAKTDRPIAALLKDLKRRGLWEDTLVVWGTEFGRTPAAQGTDGRDHHPNAFTMWMAGAGVRGGTVYGATDEFGYYVVENKVTIPDFHATILHLCGLDHTQLTYRHAGRDFRLTDVHGHAVKEILT